MINMKLGSRGMALLGRSSSTRTLLAVSEHSHNDTNDLSNSSGRDTAPIRMVSLRRHKSVPQLLRAPAGRPPQKHVSFAEEECAVIGTADAPKHLRDKFYTHKELRKMIDEAQHLGEDVAWKQDRHIGTCICHCYNFVCCEGLTEQEALEYYFTYQANDDDNNPTTLRGLERQICPHILDYRMGVVQSVLACQTKLRETQELATAKAEEKLAAVSLTNSKQAKFFARLLGKADAAISGTPCSNTRNPH